MSIHALVTGAIFLTGYLHGVIYGAEAENAAWPFISVMVVFIVDFPVAYLAKIMGFESFGIIFIWIGGTIMWGLLASMPLGKDFQKINSYFFKKCVLRRDVSRNI